MGLQPDTSKTQVLIVGAGNSQVQESTAPVGTVAATVMLPVMAVPMQWMVELTAVEAKIWLALR